MKILVTGGSGFIGSALVRSLLEHGYEVRVLDNHRRGMPHRLADISGDIELIEADVRRADEVTRAAEGVDIVAHLAALNGTENFYNHPQEVLDIGVRGMLAVMDACQANGIGRLIVASSSEVYQSPPVIPTPETVPMVIPDNQNPRYSYAGSKLISELIALNYGKAMDQVTLFRPHNVYGPDMGWEHVLPQLVERAVEHCQKHPSGTVPFEIQGDGSQTRAFNYISDAVDSIITIIEHGRHRETYHVGTNEELTIAEVARLLFGTLGREMTLVPGPMPEGQTLRRCPDITKVQQLGYTPKVPFEAGLKPTVDWYKAEVEQRLATPSV